MLPSSGWIILDAASGRMGIHKKHVHQRVPIRNHTEVEEAPSFLPKRKAQKLLDHLDKELNLPKPKWGVRVDGALSLGRSMADAQAQKRWGGRELGEDAFAEWLGFGRALLPAEARPVLGRGKDDGLLQASRLRAWTAIVAAASRFDEFSSCLLTSQSVQNGGEGGVGTVQRCQVRHGQDTLLPGLGVMSPYLGQVFSENRSGCGHIVVQGFDGERFDLWQSFQALLFRQLE